MISALRYFETERLVKNIELLEEDLEAKWEIYGEKYRKERLKVREIYLAELYSRNVELKEEA